MQCHSPEPKREATFQKVEFTFTKCPAHHGAEYGLLTIIKAKTHSKCGHAYDKQKQKGTKSTLQSCFEEAMKKETSEVFQKNVENPRKASDELGTGRVLGSGWSPDSGWKAPPVKPLPTAGLG